MRSILICLGTIVLLGCGFFVYFMLQAGPQRSGHETTFAQTRFEPPPPTPGASGQVIGPGEDVWVITPDEKTGEIAFQFRASRYDPQPDGDVRVERPQAELFLGEKRSQVVRIEGVSGRVVMDSDLTQRGPVRGRDTGAPRRGMLNDVTISLFDKSDRTRALLVCRVNNVAFDNDTFRIATEGYSDGTREISGDQVPVEVRGQDFDFDGRGLTIRWNEADRRLQLLEIAHGESLTIKSPQMLEALDGAVDNRELPASAPSAPAPPADADQPRQPEAKAAPQAPPKGQLGPGAQPPPVYRATFNEAVSVMQAQAAIAAADQMLVDFMGDTRDAAPSRASEKEAESLAPPPARTSPPASAPAPGGPAAGRAAEPIMIRWTGKLRITALEGDAPRPAPGSFNIAMHGEHAPVVLNHQGLKMSCAGFDYRSGDDSLTVTSSNFVPLITLELEDGTTVKTPSIKYEGADAQATLRGAGRAQIRVQSERDREAAGGEGGRVAPGAADEAEMLAAAWDESCVLSLARDRERRVSLERAALKGKVHVEHPRLSLKSAALELGFTPGTSSSKPALSDLTAAGTVQCRVLDPKGAHNEITCDQLNATVATMPDGALALRTVSADGNVLASGDDSQLSAGHLTFTVVPAAAPARGEAAEIRPASAIFAAGDFQLESLKAQQDVKVKLRDGSSAAAQQLDMQLSPEGAVFVLLGQPSATLSDGTNTLTGANIKIAYDAQQLRVHGPGTLAFDARESPDEPARPVQIAWQSGLSVDAPQNQAQITGGVTIASDAPDGAKQVASGQRVEIALADAPHDDAGAARDDAGAARDAVAGADKGPDQPARPARFAALQGKTLRSLTIAGDAQVQSILHGENESEFRRLHLLAPELRYDLPARRAEVPAAGRMLVQDTRRAADPAQAKEPRAGDFRGATAFQWHKNLVLDQSASQITMSGSVQIVHQDESDPAQTFRLQASQVVADLMPDGDAPSTLPADEGAAVATPLGPSQVKIKALSAEGEVILNLAQARIEAHTVRYDAPSDLLRAEGDQRTPVHVFNEEGVSRGSFQEVVWNLKTDHMQMREVRAHVRH